MQTAESEIQSGKRFAFGQNWTSFLETLDESRIEIAVDSLRQLLQVDDLSDKSFLDAGCGSGLFSLAASRLGARVVSFDFDPQSVACARELQRRFANADAPWMIQTGSVLDDTFLQSLGQFDVVYSWGVLHHTGQMHTALRLLPERVPPQGLLALALYNDQGLRSRAWWMVKRLYCANPLGRALMSCLFYPWFFIRTLAVSVIRRRNEFATYRRHRGMSIVHDWRDWLGGYPFEVISFDGAVQMMSDQGFELVNSKRTRRLGCNEFVFRRATIPAAAPASSAASGGD